ncbi:MAG: hypothetical protein QM328_04855, partial [Acidobacteriota bacterium]|nr:hypothetical protein [Acidobacteriota bacterium]
MAHHIASCRLLTHGHKLLPRTVLRPWRGATQGLRARPLKWDRPWSERLCDASGGDFHPIAAAVGWKSEVA